MVRKVLTRIKQLIKNKRYQASIIYSFLIDRVKIDQNVILYESYSGKSVTGNVYALFLELQKENKYQHIWCVNDVEKYESTDNVKYIKRGSIKYLYYLCRAKYLINNTSFPAFFQKKPGQVYINTWHGTPYKKMGIHEHNAKFGHYSNVLRNFLQVDYLVMPNKFTADTFGDAYYLRDLYEGYVLTVGSPRIDLSFQDNDEIRRELGIDFSKKTLLYAPTWRSDNEEMAEIANEVLMSLVNNYQDEYNILYKGHYLDKGETEKFSNIVEVSNEIDTNKLLSIVDVLVTDYSSIFFDYLPLRRPIIFYMKDIERYEETRGLYDLGSLPGEVVKNPTELVEALKNPVVSKRINKFIKTYTPEDDGTVSRKVIDIIFHKTNIHALERYEKSNKKKILIYGGSFRNNGVTSSMCNLLNHLDYSKYDVFLLLRNNIGEEQINVYNSKCNKNIKIIFMQGAWNIKFSELFTLFATFKKRKVVSDQVYDKLMNLYKRAAYRLLGDSKFDVAIDYSGYGYAYYGLIAASNSDKKIIYLHSDMKKEWKERPKIAHYPLLFKFYEKAFDKLVTVSESSYLSNSSSFPRLSEKMIVINNPLDTDRILELSKEENEIKVDKNCVNFINIGRYSVEKGQERLIHAFAYIEKQYANARLYLVGYGPEEKNLHRLIEKYNLMGKVILTGELINPFPLLKECDYFVLPSKYEGQGLVLLEAMVLGVPCISVDIPGPRSILEGGYGLLVENSTEGLILGMEVALQTGIKVKKFNFKKYTEQSIKKFYELIEK